MNRFRPTLEALDSRDLPSTVAAGPANFTPGLVLMAETTDTGDAPADDQDASDSAKKTGGKTMKIRLSDILIVRYETKSSR